MPVVLQQQVPQTQTSLKIGSPAGAVCRQSGGCACDHAGAPGEQACRVPTDLHQQGCRSARGDATTGPPGSDSGEDGGGPTGALRRQSCGGACVHADAPGDHTCRDPVDSKRRQGCRHACGDGTTGPSDSDSGEVCGSPARAFHRQNSGRACDQAVDAATGPLNSECGEDVGSPARAVRLQSRESTCDYPDQPGDQARRNPTDSVH